MQKCSAAQRPSDGGHGARRLQAEREAAALYEKENADCNEEPTPLL
jgi:hypothetical protein